MRRPDPRPTTLDAFRTRLARHVFDLFPAYRGTSGRVT